MMNDEDIRELHKLLEDHCIKKGFSRPQVLAFLSTCLVGTMALHGYSNDFFDLNCERLKRNFRMKKKEIFEEIEK